MPPAKPPRRSWRLHLTAHAAFYQRRVVELKSLVLDADPEDQDWPESVRTVCKALAGGDADTSTKESIVLAQSICNAAVGSKDHFTLYDRCLGYDCRQDVTLHDRFKDLMTKEWKTMPKNGQRAWEHIVNEHNHLPYCKYKRAVFLRWMTPVSGIEAYCAHRLRSVHPCNTDKLRDCSEKVYDFFRNVPKSMPVFKVALRASSPAYQGWLLVKPMIEDWFSMRNDERAGWIAGAMSITARAAKQIESDDDDGDVLVMQLNLLPEHGTMETHNGLEWMRFFNAAQPLAGDRKTMVFGSSNVYISHDAMDEQGREGWCRTDTYEESMKSDAFRRAITNTAPKMDSTFHTLDLEFGEDDNPGILSKACLQAIRQGWVTSWTVGVSNPKRLGKHGIPVVASQVTLATGGCSARVTMTAKIKREWLDANPPPLRDGVPHDELLGWFKGTWLAELLTHQSNSIQTMRIDEEVERQKRKEAASNFNMKALARSFLAAVWSEKDAEGAAATKLQSRWRGREARRGCVLKEDSFVFTDIASTRYTALEAALAAFESGDDKTKAKKRKPKKPLALPPPENAQTRTHSVPAWWPRELPKQVPLGTNRIFPASWLFNKLESGSSWVLGSVWPTHVEDARPPRSTTVVEHDQQVELARIDPDWNRVFAITESAKKSGLVAKWVIGFSYTHDELGREIQPPDLAKYTNTKACAFASTMFSEATLPDGRVDVLTALKNDPHGDCIVNMHFQRLVFQTTRENKNSAWLTSCRAEDEQRAIKAAEALLLEEDQKQVQKATKSKKKADAKRAREQEQAEKARLVKEASEAAAKTLASNKAASVAAHAEEQRRIAKSKKEELERAEAAKFEAVLAKKQAVEAEAAKAAVLAVEHARKETREAAHRAHAEEAERVRDAQMDLMARLCTNTVIGGKGRGRPNTGRGGRGGRGTATIAPATSVAPPKEDDDSKLCVVCCENEKTRVVVPCGHCCLCNGCASNKAITTCPICRAAITIIIPCFF